MNLENINTNGLPDESELEKIANALFKSVPGGLQNKSEFNEDKHNQFSQGFAPAQKEQTNDLGKISPNLVNQNNLGLGKLYLTHISIMVRFQILLQEVVNHHHYKIKI